MKWRETGEEEKKGYQGNGDKQQRGKGGGEIIGCESKAMGRRRGWGENTIKG